MTFYGINFFLNVLKITKQKKCSIINVKFSKKLVNIFLILLKEGFIRGYFFGLNKNKRTAYILLKHTDLKTKCMFDKVFLGFYKEYFLKKYLLSISNGFSFFIISTQIGFVSNYTLLHNKFI